MDWTPFLSDVGDTLATSVWDGGGLTTSAPAIETGNLSAVVWLEGGAAGTVYTVANKVTTAGGRVIERSFDLEVVDR